MAVDMKTQASVLRQNISDYPQYSAFEISTNTMNKLSQALGYDTK